MDAAVYWYALCAVALFVKMFALSGYQGFHRIGTRAFTNPEDARVAGVPPAAEELPQVQRAARAWRNDLENIPAFFGLGAAYVLVGASPALAPWYFLTFTIARVVHSLAYLLALQPWRTIAYAVGVACLLGMSASILAALA